VSTEVVVDSSRKNVSDRSRIMLCLRSGHRLGVCNAKGISFTYDKETILMDIQRRVNWRANRNLGYTRLEF
jgi:hypothetical protein